MSVLSFCMSVLSVCMSVLSVCISVSLSICLFACISILARALVSETCDRKTYVAIVFIGQLLFFSFFLSGDYFSTRRKGATVLKF